MARVEPPGDFLRSKTTWGAFSFIGLAAGAVMEGKATVGQGLIVSAISLLAAFVRDTIAKSARTLLVGLTEDRPRGGFDFGPPMRGRGFDAWDEGQGFGDSNFGWGEAAPRAARDLAPITDDLRAVIREELKDALRESGRVGP